MQQCRFCGRWFKNKQGVRAHLRWCPKYRGTGGPIVPPTIINIPQKPKSEPLNSAQHYRMSPRGGYRDEFNRRQPEIAAGRDSRDFRPVEICVRHYNCVICPHCHAHIAIEKVYTTISREGRCPFCDRWILYLSGTRPVSLPAVF